MIRLRDRFPLGYLSGPQTTLTVVVHTRVRGVGKIPSGINWTEITISIVFGSFHFPTLSSGFCFTLDAFHLVFVADLLGSRPSITASREWSISNRNPFFCRCVNHPVPEAGILDHSSPVLGLNVVLLLLAPVWCVLSW